MKPVARSTEKGRGKRKGSAGVPQLKIRMPKITMPQWEVLLSAVEYHEAEEVLERGFPKATCSGPERFWMAQRLKAKETLLKACAHLKSVEESWRPKL